MLGGNDAEEAQQTPSSFPVKRIRSGVRRRIMECLSEGRATVSQISTSTSIRLPHVSAELKRLRDENLVFSDEESGSRGACLALTARGWDTIRSDEIARLQDLPKTTPPVGALGRLISVTGNQLLVAFVRRPQSGPIAIPSLPLDSKSRQSSEESWAWVEPRERKPRWVSSESFQPVPPPPREIDTSSIAAWGAEIQVWGLQRFRLIDVTQPLQLATGAWFGEMENLSSGFLPKQIPNSGRWRLGTLASDGPTIEVSAPVIGIGLDRLCRMAVLTSASQSAITISAHKFREQSSNMPLDALENWMRIAHPRIRESDRTERLLLLREYLLETDEQQRNIKRRRVDDSTLRRFQSQWGELEWSQDTFTGGEWLDTSSLSQNAEKALIEWSLEHLVHDISIEIRFQNSLSQISSSRIPENVRLILVNEWSNPPRAHQIIPHPVLSSMWARLTLLGGFETPVNLSTTVSPEVFSEEIVWTPPTKADEVESSRHLIGVSTGISLSPSISVEESEDRLMRAAVLSFPEGNSEWANRMEHRYPVVAWIASESQDRWSRWERIGGDLGSDWIDLMNPRDIPADALSSAAFSSSPSWNRELIQITRMRIRESPEVAQTLRHTAESTNPRQTAWIAKVLLSEVAWLSPELQSDMSTWGLDNFLEDPPERCSAAISGLDWLANQYSEAMLSESEDWRQDAIQVGYSKHQEHDLHLWAVLSDWFESDNRPHSSVMRLIVKHLPEEWWAPFAETILTVLSDDQTGISLISELDIAWPSLILRPQGEYHRIPGNFSTHHRGVRRTLLSRLERLLENEMWSDTLQGSLMIQDLSEALRAARDLTPPNFGLVHPMVRWLALPVHRWPPNDMTLMTRGYPRITARVTKLVSGWHADLSRNILDI
ncbi:MAG: winged helix-turn-helix domain-containing protein [Candidatus Thermoplasmatota archaeon]|nr:winged helix-turn-helix domain-containing protein [Candidatus Thermoplasmatota archaeon]